MGDSLLQNRPHFRPHISATPRDENDTGQHVSLKTNDVRNQIDTPQPMKTSFQSPGVGIETRAAHD
jgi:hypothetical protein